LLKVLVDKKNLRKFASYIYWEKKKQASNRTLILSDETILNDERAAEKKQFLKIKGSIEKATAENAGVKSAKNNLLVRSVLPWVAVCCNVLQCVALCCSVLQCVAVCCSVLQSESFAGVHCVI